MDLISERELLPEEAALAKRVKNITFNTANGGTWSEKEVMFNIEPLLECVFVRILKSTPAVLSMGMRCVGQGYSFHWPAGQNPIFIRPDKQVVKLQVLGDIPYLTNARSTVEVHRANADMRILSAMPAPIVLPSKWEKRTNEARNAQPGIINEHEGCSDEEIDEELENISGVADMMGDTNAQARDEWGYANGEVKRFHDTPRSEPFDPSQSLTANLG